MAVIILMELVVTVQLMPSVLGDIEWRFVGPMGAVAAEMERLAPLIADGICTVEESRITVTGKGRPYVRLVAAACEAYLTAGGPRHSGAV